MARSPSVSSRPNLEQVAAAAGVSRATVSRVVNRSPSVDPELRRRVEQAVDELGYVPNHAARALVTRRSDTIALVASEPDSRVFGDPFFSDIIRGVSHQATSAGLALTLMLTQTDAELARVESYLRAAPLDGVLLISEHAAHDPLPAAMTQAGVPVVIGGRPLSPDVVVPYVDNDNVDGGRQAAEHLLKAGRSRIGTLAGPGDMAAGVDRLAGFRVALGRRYRARRVERGEFTTASGERAMTRLLHRAPDLDGVFVASDLMALGALHALRRAGRRVPDDVAVVGFDDTALAAHSDPPLTTVRQETVLQGRAMVALLLAQLRPQSPPEPVEGLPDLSARDHLVLPVRLVVRESG